MALALGVGMARGRRGTGKTHVHEGRVYGWVDGYTGTKARGAG